MSGFRPDKDEFSASDAALIAAVIDGIGGAATRDSVVLSNTSAWVQVPTTAPTSTYTMVVSVATQTGTIRWSFSNSGTPGTAVGNILSSRDIIFTLEANQVVYFNSTVGTDRVNAEMKIN